MGFDPEWAVAHSVDSSAEVYSIFHHGELVSIIGIVDDGVTGISNPWLLSTSLILNRPKEVVKVSRKLYHHFITRYGYLTNFVDQRHTRAIEWLRWLGARFTPVPEYGPYRRPFYQFEFGEL